MSLVSKHTLYGFALTGGYAFAETWDKQTKAQLLSAEVGPRQSVKLALNFDNNNLGLRGALTGNYDRLNALESDLAKSQGMIWDLHLTQQLLPGREMTPELYLSIRNIFNGSQYQFDFRPNNPRYYEGGLRFRF